MSDASPGLVRSAPESSQTVARGAFSGAPPAAEPGLRAVHLAGYVCFAAAVIAAPLIFPSIYDLNVMVTAAINVILATGLAIVVRAGRLSLAQATFSGVGGYTSGLLVTQMGWPYWPALIAAGVLAGIIGGLLGLTSLRLRGFYFAIATFTFSQIFIILLGASGSVTGGQSGLFGLPNPPPIGPFAFSNPRVYYYFAVLVALVALGIRYACTTGMSFGRALTVLGEDDVLAGALGVPATSYRLAAFGISSFIAGIGGSLYAHFIQGISPPDIAPSVSVFVLVMVMSGGFRSMIGPVIGAIVLTLIPELLRASAQWSMVFYGLFLIAYVFLFRDGMVPILEQGLRAALGQRTAPRVPLSAVTNHVVPTHEPPHRKHDRGSADVLELEGVRCAFGENVVIKNLSLALRRGEMHGLIGPNGAGKTTLFNTITGMAPLTAGHVKLNGTAVAPRPDVMARAGLARTFQHPRILESRTVRANLALAAELCGRPIQPGYLDWVVEVTGLASDLDVLGSKLSHYERRLLTIAMAIAGDPDILLLDEPLAGLDETETSLAKERIKDIHAALGCTVLLIEHKLGVVIELCGRLTVLDDGEIIASGVPETVARDPAVIEAYLGS